MTMFTDYDVVDTDYVDGSGVLHISPNYTGNVLIRSNADLTGISALDHYQPGAMAHTAGWAAVWELGNDGTTWVAINAVG